MCPWCQPRVRPACVAEVLIERDEVQRDDHRDECAEEHARRRAGLEDCCDDAERNGGDGAADAEPPGAEGAGTED